MTCTMRDPRQVIAIPLASICFVIHVLLEKVSTLMLRLRMLAVALLAVSIAFAVGCNKDKTSGGSGSGSSPAPGPGGGPGWGSGLTPEGPHAAGMKVFNDQRCTNCHTVGGGPGKKVDLAGVAAKPEYADEGGLRDFILDPKSKKPMTRMPSFQGKINDDDFKALLAYLASLK